MFFAGFPCGTESRNNPSACVLVKHTGLLLSPKSNTDTDLIGCPCSSVTRPSYLCDHAIRGNNSNTIVNQTHLAQLLLIIFHQAGCKRLRTKIGITIVWFRHSVTEIHITTLILPKFCNLTLKPFGSTLTHMVTP